MSDDDFSTNEFGWFLDKLRAHKLNLVLMCLAVLLSIIAVYGVYEPHLKTSITGTIVRIDELGYGILVEDGDSSFIGQTIDVDRGICQLDRQFSYTNCNIGAYVNVTGYVILSGDEFWYIESILQSPSKSEVVHVKDIEASV